MLPRLAIPRNSGTSNGQSALGWLRAISSNINALEKYSQTKRRNHVPGPRRRSSRALICDTRMKPAALQPNSQP